MPQGVWPRVRSDRSRHRYAGCESDRKRGVSIDPVGYDAGKKTKGIKRNAIVDTEGHLLSIEVIAANTQDRDCAADLIKQALRQYPRLRKLFADGGYAGPKLAGALSGEPVEIEIVKRTDKDGGFKVMAAPQPPPDGPLRSAGHGRCPLRQTRDDLPHAQATDLRRTMIYNANFRFRL
jgi:hypothetical protein